MIGYDPKRKLSQDEWLEILALEYVLTWNYTDDFDKDKRRYIELSNKKWS